MRGLNNRNLAYTVEALERLGGQAHVQRIYMEVSKLRRAKGDGPPESINMTIQGTLERFCSESDTYQEGSYDLFRMVYRKGEGVYRFHLLGLEQYRRHRNGKPPTIEEP
jgi:hypothetical protein